MHRLVTSNSEKVVYNSNTKDQLRKKEKEPMLSQNIACQRLSLF